MTRPLQPCGTIAAYARHRYHGETPCEDCRKAKAAYVRERTGSKPRHAARCGTHSGFVTHHARGETPCAECRKAHAGYERDRKARTAARKAAAR